MLDALIDQRLQFHEIDRFNFEQVPVDGSMVIDTGHLAAWESSLQYTVGKSGSGWIASWLSGEGLVCHFQGQGMVYMQSRNAAEYGSAIGSMLPPRQQ